MLVVQNGSDRLMISPNLWTTTCTCSFRATDPTECIIIFIIIMILCYVFFFIVDVVVVVVVVVCFSFQPKQIIINLNSSELEYFSPYDELHELSKIWFTIVGAQLKHKWGFDIIILFQVVTRLHTSSRVGFGTQCTWSPSRPSKFDSTKRGECKGTLWKKRFDKCRKPDQRVKVKQNAIQLIQISHTHISTYVRNPPFDSIFGNLSRHTICMELLLEFNFLFCGFASRGSFKAQVCGWSSAFSRPRPDRV